LFCQCHRCLETFTVDVVVKGRSIIQLDPHSHIRQGQGIKTHHYCGGNLAFFN